MSSPNFNDRKLPVSMLILHYTGMENGVTAKARLCDPAAEVSAHWLVHEDGMADRLVDEDKRAWHAGRGSWNGITDVNSASIGIEIVNGGHNKITAPTETAQHHYPKIKSPHGAGLTGWLWKESALVVYRPTIRRLMGINDWTLP